MKKLKGVVFIALAILTFSITGCGGNSENINNTMQGRDDESWLVH